MSYSRAGLFSLLVVYLVWGSTFLAIRVAVTGQGFDPYALAALRTLGAGGLLLLLARGQGHSLRLAQRDLLWLAFTGVVLWVGGHTLLIWASRRMDSGLSALLFASIPLWSALLTRNAFRSLSRLLPVAAGFLGVALVFPVTPGAVDSTALLDGAVVLFSAFLWSLGSVLGVDRRIPVALASGYQLLFAGLVNALAALALGSGWASPDTRAWIACAYLILPGCVLAFLAYAHTLRTLPVPLVMSFAYVNPLVAVALGVLLLGETVSARTAGGIAVVLASVFWLFRSERAAT